ncbi:hypothetical protein PTT_09081 [Pyrenophora teres f. teres 0-1]|uniref:Uncharacterized protein n=2 Tax=Pyrenophora teres f. teres TaxID=97479 RepID=E3RL58_PYRTT|nr:hypothetical protein PTT_09081 [Pyrenophora teres f. teres 0-1]CAE7175874.1 hypothetical protein PTTW11_05893 [Pyrenophora teres f. teres]
MSFLTKLLSGPKSQSTTLPTAPVSDDWELICPLEAISEAEDNNPTSTSKSPPTSTPTSTCPPAFTRTRYNSHYRPSPATKTPSTPPCSQTPNPQLTQPHKTTSIATEMEVKTESETETETETEKYIKHHPFNQRYKHSRLNIQKGKANRMGVEMPCRQPGVPPRAELLSRGMVENFVWGKVWGMGAGEV